MASSLNGKSRRTVMYVVTSVWAASFLADIFIDTYEPSPFIHMAMMSILGAIFGREILGKENDDA